MNIIAKIYSCNKLTYKNIYKDAIKRAYKLDGIDVLDSDIKMQIIDLSDGGTKEIQQQRAPAGEHCRVIQVYEKDNIKYIIGLSNTNFDEDIRVERQTTNRKNVYGSDGYHANTYLMQGINKIFSRYFDLKQLCNSVKLYFYLLDVDQTYPHNKFNLCTYRMLSTLGFSILNIDEINFDAIKEFGFRPNRNFSNIQYVSLNKLMNDKLAIAKRNTGNIPAYLKCVEAVEDDGTIVTEKYIYVFKSLGAQAYDCFLTMWTLDTLAKRENKNLEFMLSLERFGFKRHENKITKDLPGPVKKMLHTVGISTHYETSEEVLQDENRELSQFEKARVIGDIRNQLLFRNNIRAKGILMKCPICGCDIEDVLEAAHIWGIGHIKSENGRNINRLLDNTILHNLIDDTHPFKNDIFYKRYVLANSGDNGVWLCRNHHGLFDDNYYCFDSEFGKVIVPLGREQEISDMLGIDLNKNVLTEDILTEETKIYINKRMEEFYKTF